MTRGLLFTKGQLFYACRILRRPFVKGKEVRPNADLNPRSYAVGLEYIPLSAAIRDLLPC